MITVQEQTVVSAAPPSAMLAGQGKFYESALWLAAKGFHVFPLVDNSKLPRIKNFPHRATRDEATIKQWWCDGVMDWPQPWNIGVSTSRFGDPDANGNYQALVVVDVDTKEGKQGAASLVALELQGLDLPITCKQTTASKGAHLIYSAPVAVKQGANVLGSGIDIRSAGGYIVGAGSEIDGRAYSMDETPIAPAPEWLIERCGKPKERAASADVPVEGVDPERAAARAVEYLLHTAPLAVEGEGGDSVTYAVAAKLKDFGVSKHEAVDLMADYWNDRCSPPWGDAELSQKVLNAWRFGKSAPGSAAAERQFEAVPEEDEGANWFNHGFAFVVINGTHSILRETKGEKGQPKVEHWNEDTFNKRFASWTMTVGEKKTPLTKIWMNAPARQTKPSADNGDARNWRRTYDGICFSPGEEPKAGYYNLWRGFSCTPLGDDEKPSAEANWALAAFLEHAEQNVCQGDKELNRWLIGYFAHMVQKPNEKVLVALVMKGEKGVGKNALVERVFDLFGAHAIVSGHRRYLQSNFNGHMEALVGLCLDEAVWAGDKQGAGHLKALITGDKHLIERKGCEPYEVNNRLRVVLLGNEDWIAPASADERRWAVFLVGNGRKQQRKFFERMRLGMQTHGGDRLLLRYLLDYDLTGIQVNAAPITEGLLDQKQESLEPFPQWWFACLSEGCIVKSEFSNSWPEDMDTQRVYSAANAYIKNLGFRALTDGTLGRKLKAAPVALSRARRSKTAKSGEQPSYYVFPSLERARQAWSDHIGHPISWA